MLFPHSGYSHTELGPVRVFLLMWEKIVNIQEKDTVSKVGEINSWTLIRMDVLDLSFRLKFGGTCFLRNVNVYIRV